MLRRQLERVDWRYGEFRDWSWICDADDSEDSWQYGKELMEFPSCVIVPLGKFSELPGVIGLFYSVCDPEVERPFLEQLAVMLSFAAKRCWLFQRERQINRRLQDAKQEANELKQKYERLISLQQHFTDTSLMADGFDPVLGRLGEWLKVPIVLLDSELRLVASYTPNVPLETAWVRTLEERRLHADIADRSSFQHALRQAQADGNRPLAVEYFLSDTKEMYWLAGIDNGFHVWGYLFWRGPLPPLSEETVHAIRMAANALSMVYYGQYEQTLRQRPSFLEAFLAGHYASVEAAAEHARLEGCDIGKMSRLLIVEPGVTARSISELKNMAEGAVRGLGFGFHTGIYAGAIVMLLESGADEKAAAEKVFERMKASDADALIGVSRKFRDLGDMRDAYDQVRRSLALFRKRGERRAVVRYDALGVYRLLLNTERTELEDMIEKALGPLLGLEKKQSDELLSTLLHYIRTGGSIQQAAEQCYVHINTVKYRLKRITQLLGADLSSPDERFRLEVALRAMEILDL
jgi:sugar diacid utilization regulator